MKFKPPPKRTKIDAAPSCSSAVSESERQDVVRALNNKSTVHETQTSSVNLRIQQDRDAAVAQAQQEGCTGNFRIFDSPYGNFLVPVIPTHAELGG